MANNTWVNFFVKDLYARGTEGHCTPGELGDKIKTNEHEAYHCAFELDKAALKREEDTGQLDAKGKPIYRYHAQISDTTSRFPASFNRYNGTTRPAFGYVYFDFDSSDAGASAHSDAKKFLSSLNHGGHARIYYSGSKGFHLAVPLVLFGIEENPKLPAQLNFIAHHFKKEFKTLDTTVYNAQRKFRADGSRHPKTGLFKIELSAAEFNDLTIEQIKDLAKTRRVPNTMIAPDKLEPLPELRNVATSFVADVNDSISFKEWYRYKTPEGTRAFEECDFLKHCKENPAKISEPEWYAAASIVGRFKDGRAKFQAMSKGHPNYSASTTNDKLDQALGSAGPRTCKGIQALWGKCFECKHFEKIKSPVVILEKDVISTESAGFYFQEMDSKGNIKYKPDYEGLLRAFKRDRLYFRDESLDKTYIYTGTHYKNVSNIHVLGFAEDNMLPAPTQKIAGEFLSKVLRNELRDEDDLEKFFHTTTHGKLNVKNGIYDILEGTLTPHDPSFGFRYVLPYDFDASAKAPHFEKFLDEVTLGRAELKQTILEFIGYIFWPQWDDHCFLWLSGTGRNGKSTLMELVQALVGEFNYSNVLLKDFEKPNYLQMMDHKLVNISEESDTNKIPAAIMGTLKALSAGAKVQVDQKFEIPYSMTPTAKLIFAANKPPYLSGTEGAIKSRMIVVPFDLMLEDHLEAGSVSKIDHDLLKRLKGELPGILNLALDALRGFVRRSRRKIHRSEESKAALNEIVRDSDDVETWVQDNVKLNPKAKGIPLEALYQDFKETALESEYLPDLKSFARRVNQKLGGRIRVERTRVNGKQTRMYFGIELEALNIEF